MREIEVLKNGGLLLYPTDTIWGLGCDATNGKAIERLNAVKGRSDEKHLLVVVSDLEMLQNYVSNVPKAAEQLIAETTDPLTIIYSNAKNLPEILIGTEQTIGIRIPRFTWLENLIQQFGKPIISTSANFSGQPSPRCFDEIADEIKQWVDYVSYYGREFPPCRQASKIVKISDNEEISILRN